MGELHARTKELKLQDEIDAGLQREIDRLEDKIKRLNSRLDDADLVYLALLEVLDTVHTNHINESLRNRIKSILLKAGLIR